MVSSEDRAVAPVSPVGAEASLPASPVERVLNAHQAKGRYPWRAVDDRDLDGDVERLPCAESPVVWLVRVSSCSSRATIVPTDFSHVLVDSRFPWGRPPPSVHVLNASPMVAAAVKVCDLSGINRVLNLTPSRRTTIPTL